jgi:hypothetical protein
LLTKNAFSGPFGSLCSAVDRKVGWHRLPRPLGIVTLIGIRTKLRERNLHDTGLVKPPPPRPPNVDVRTVDGSYNDLERPAMGMIHTRFGRNVPRGRTFPETEPELLDPNPRLVSRELLARDRFIPACTVNALVAAWLQFEVHDWLSHETEDANPYEIPLREGDDWPENPMKIQRTKRDTSGDEPGAPATFPTFDTHWWDGSQIYGNTKAFADAVRANEDGKLKFDDGEILHPPDLDPHVDPPGIRGNFWVGLGLLHTLFMREHNAICDRLRKEHPTWPDDKLYDRARLINAAVMAKIHTVEWTPAVIAHPTTVRGMHANWYGLVGERFTKRFGRLGPSEVLSGIPGSPTDHHGVPYSLTEEFVAVYRMHPLIPDDYVFRSAADGKEIGKHTLGELTRPDRTRERLHEIGVANALYSFGVAHSGAIKLHNYPRSLQAFEPDQDRPPIDLATIDILRIRERGVPRYNEFRKLFHRQPVTSFEDLTRDCATAEELRRIYGDVDRLDLLVGLYAEPLPKGFAFSDTTFRVFVLMASRRLKSDRFFTTDYTRERYTQTGLDWINETTMKTVLLRHYKELGPALHGIDNAFKPWNRVKG